jgi:hypothetical protein
MTPADIARALDIGDAVEAELKSRGAIVHFGAYAKGEAISAAREIIDLDPFETGFPQKFAALQNTIRRYQELSAWTRMSLHEAKDAYDTLPEHEKREMLQYLTAPTTHEVNDE